MYTAPVLMFWVWSAADTTAGFPAIMRTWAEDGLIKALQISP